MEENTLKLEIERGLIACRFEIDSLKVQIERFKEKLDKCTDPVLLGYIQSRLDTLEYSLDAKYIEQTVLHKLINK